MKESKRRKEGPGRRKEIEVRKEGPERRKEIEVRKEGPEQRMKEHTQLIKADKKGVKECLDYIGF